MLREARTNLELASEKNWLQRIIQSKVQTTVDNDSNTRDVESTVKPSNTICLESLAVDINKTIELPLTSSLGCLCVVSQPCPSIVKRVHKKQRGSTSSSTRSKVASKPLPVTISVLLEVEQTLEVILEGKVQSLQKIEQGVNQQIYLKGKITA